MKISQIKKKKNHKKLKDNKIIKKKIKMKIIVIFSNM